MPKPLLLLVDDAPEMAALVRALAARAGCEVVACGDAGAAWAALQARRPDLVLLDVNPPGARAPGPRWRVGRPADPRRTGPGRRPDAGAVSRGRRPAGGPFRGTAVAPPGGRRGPGRDGRGRPGAVRSPSQK